MQQLHHPDLAPRGPMAPAMDEEGFLLDPTLWSRELAEQWAAEAELEPLNDRHWRLIADLREKCLTLGALPPLRHICRRSGLSRHELKRLFGSCRQLWQIAGLPNPGEEARSYMN